MKPRYIPVYFAILFIGALRISQRPLFIFLPGTQPGTVDDVDSVGTCASCHSSPSPTRPVTIVNDWSGSMMAHAARDPVFFAAMAVANKYTNSAGEWCLRCHSPSGWLAGRGMPPSGQGLAGTDFDGVQCDCCHRAGDPLNPDSTVPYLLYKVPGYGNGMYVSERARTPKRGPYLDTLSAHTSLTDSFQSSSGFCAVCHEASNPVYASDRLTQAPYEFAPIERTYSEWLSSWYASLGPDGTCQSCHMNASSGYDCNLSNTPLRNNLRRHDLTGGNTFVPAILPDFWTGLDTSSLQAGRQRAEATLRRAARLDADSYRLGDSVVTMVKVTNLTGHKLPTGYTEGRRMWISVVGQNLNGDTVFRSGTYLADSALLLKDPQLKVYESVMGLTDSLARFYGLKGGASFHLFLNDTVLSDDRIPPRGFTNTLFRLRKAQPVGYAYADGQYWDSTKYVLPGLTSSVTVTLYYQTVSREYVEFLSDENNGNAYDWNSWGSKLYDSWSKRGRSRPVAMNTISVAVRDSILGTVHNAGGYLPTSFYLMQNYPNPFNPTTGFRFRIVAAGLVSLRIYDVIGKEIATVVNREMPPGEYRITWDATNVPSGVYFAKLISGKKQQSRKMLLLR